MKYDNSHLCGECTGAGCKQCYDPLGLRPIGYERFPLSPVSKIKINKAMRTIYFVEVDKMQYVTTDVTAMAEFCIFMNCLGNSEERGTTDIDIPLTRINPDFRDLLFPATLHFK